MRHIERAGFMSLKPDLELREWPHDTWTDLRMKTYTIDVLVLIAIVLGASLLAWAWVGKPYRSGAGGTTARLSTLVLVFVGLPFGLFSIVQATPVTANSKLAEIDFITAPSPMTWTKATLYCAGRKAQVASLEEFLSIYKSIHFDLTAGAYWLAPASPTVPKPKGIPTNPELVQTTKLEQIPLEKLSAPIVRSTSRAWNAKTDPMQSQRFLCIPSAPMVQGKK
jgi:hypothetical protein